MDENRRPEGRGAAGRALRYLKERGVKEFSAHALELYKDSHFDYNEWVRRQIPSPTVVGYQKKLWMKRSPKIYLMVRSSEGHSPQDKLPDMERTAASLRASTYRNASFAQTLTSHIADDDFIALVREGDMVTMDALFELVQALQGGADAVYSDEDSYELDPEGGIRCSRPLFKPDFSPEYLRSMNYIGSIFMVRAGIVRSFYPLRGERKSKDLFFPGRDDSLEKLKEKKKDYWEMVPSASALADEAAYYDFVLRCALRSAGQGGVAHVPKVLCHAKKRGRAMISPSKLRRVLEQDLVREGIDAFIEGGPDLRSFHIRREPLGNPLVSIVIPSRDQVESLRECIQSIRRHSSWKNKEIVIVENNSVCKETFAYYDEICEQDPSVRVIDRSRPFNFSALVNEGVLEAKGEYIILMNNDVTVRTEDWIERLLGCCQAEGVGAVGPKLLFPDGRVQSAGITVGLMGFAGSMMTCEAGDDPGYMNRASVLNNFSAVTAACMMVPKKLYMGAGGFSTDLAVSLNDVDFCLKLGKAGRRIVLEPTALLIHHESLTRGQEDSPEKKKRFQKEKNIFCRRWRKIMKEGDPCYNPNLSDRKCDYSQKT